LQVVLIGLYNGQGLCDDNGKDMVTYCRIGEGPDRTFVRLLLSRDRLQGAVLIGDTGERIDLFCKSKSFY